MHYSLGVSLFFRTMLVMLKYIFMEQRKIIKKATAKITEIANAKK